MLRKSLYGHLGENLGRRIKQLRQERTNLSQEAFANTHDIDRTYYASIEQGRHSPSVGMFKRIADGLGVTLSELFLGL